MTHNREELEKKLRAKAEEAIRTMLEALPDKADLTMDDMENVIGKMGYKLRAVQKSRPKKIPETDAIFDQLSLVNTAADADETVLRLSLDAKVSVSVGEYARGGLTGVTIKALDMVRSICT